MKAMWRIFLILMIFFLGTIPFYAAWQQKDYGSVPEIAGPIALLMTALMMALAGWYLWVTCPTTTPTAKSRTSKATTASSPQVPGGLLRLASPLRWPSQVWRSAGGCS